MGWKPRPVCPKCEVEMYPETNGVTVVTHAHNPPVPYEAYMADLWKCRICGSEVVTGYSQNAFVTKDNPEKMAEAVAYAEQNGTLVNVWETFNGVPRKP